jgi:hypothetical protein
MTIQFDTTHEAELKALTAYQLARLADCTDPDTLVSPGAQFLLEVRDDVLQTFLEDNWSSDTYATVWGIADNAVPVMTHDIARVFVDLCAYREDLDELSPGTNDMVKLMQLAVYQIGERLAGALLEEYRHTLEEIEEA